LPGKRVDEWTIISVIWWRRFWLRTVIKRIRMTGNSPGSKTLVLVILFFCNCEQKPVNTSSTTATTAAPPGMTWIPGGEYVMGTDDEESYAHERPAHRVRIDGYWIDQTEVTNQQFTEFVEATGYVTVAERKPEWEKLQEQLPPGTLKPDDDKLVPGSLVFTPPPYAVSLNDYAQWWSYIPGADWKHPEGPGSNLRGRLSHPVVHVSYDDAVAYCAWAGKRLPTEAEWEFASRGGAEGSMYAWGGEFTANGMHMANTFQGVFPGSNTNEDGFPGSAPVRSFAPNGYGLYDMIGNVWEWTSDFYNTTYFADQSKKGTSSNPTGCEVPFDPTDPYAKKRVTKGGSFLCAQNYCMNFRPTARQGSAIDTGMSHMGFRCVVTPAMLGQKATLR
jgi:sulfatase modifying factor 1